MKYVSILFVFAVACIAMSAQPLRDPYFFSMPDDVDVDTSLIVGAIDKAGSHGRVVSKDGHLAFADGNRFRPVGVTIQVGACFPDSIQARLMAKRMRALGITCVRLANFDYTFARSVSILADGQNTLDNGLDAESMHRFDYFMNQLREHGIYYVFTFHGYWNPRPGDGVMDSTGWAARVPLIFEPAVQKIHRGIIRLLLEHNNPYTGLAYKDDPALAYVIAAEDASPMVYWMYTKDLVRSNQYGNVFNMGLVHHRYIDSLFCARLNAKGLNTDAKINASWRTPAEDPAEKVRNGGFEDPFDPSWTLGVNNTAGAQALMQYADNDKVEGTQSGRVRIGQLDAGKNSGAIYLYQVLSNMKRLHRYTLSMWAKCEQDVPSRRIAIIFHNPTYPYNSYGLQVEQRITNQWVKYDFTFTCSATEETAAAMQIQMGMETGDVYLDGVSLKEVGYEGLNPGESVTNNSIRRDPVWSTAISPNRIAEQTQFYIDALKNMLTGVRLLVRDTLNSDVLLCPSLRTFTALELHASKDYDLFTSTDYRQAAGSALSEASGGSLMQHTQYDLANKPFVLSLTAVLYPRPYQPEAEVIMPAYAGLHDWDGVFFSVFTSTPRAGNVRADSNSFWEIFDKPQVLTMLPAASNALRAFDVKPSTKVVQITNNDEMYKYPAFHVSFPYALSMYVDSRMPLFRRTEVMPDLVAQESFLPHLEVSALFGMVDPTALNAENEQIFFDATRGIMRVITPRYMAFAGTMEGQIVNEEGIIVEQTTTGKHTSVVLSSLTDNAVKESTRNLLVIGARGLNEGAVFDNENAELAIWGQGQMQLEGRGVRVTIQAPSFDSCFVQPLGNDARPKGVRRSIARSPTGRFSIEVNTKTDQSPWYRVEFSRINTSVDDEEGTSIAIAPNPATNHFNVIGENVTHVRVVDMLGNIVYNGTDATVNTTQLASGNYSVQITSGNKTLHKTINVVH